MKKLLLKVAYWILSKYEKTPIDLGLGDRFSINGTQFVITNYTVSMSSRACSLTLNADKIDG